MAFLLLIALAGVTLLGGMIGLYLLGSRLAQRFPPGDKDGGSSAAETAVFSLLGLLLSFTFFGAASRLEDRRHLITQEANDIGTAWLRLDMLPAAAQPQLRQLFRDYAEARVAAFANVADVEATRAATDQAQQLQARIWSAAVEAVRLPDAPPQAAMLLLPALNAMIDVTTTRSVAAETHPPHVIYYMLAAFSLVAAGLAGYSTRTRDGRYWLNMTLFALVVATTLVVILDLEYPRRGLIRVDSVDQVLIDVRRAMDR